MTAGDDPVTLTMAAAVASSAMAAGSSVIGGIQAEKAGNAAAEQAKNESKAALEQSGSEIAASEANAGRLIGHVKAAAGASGVTSESAKPILSEDYTQAKIRSSYLRFSGQLASTEDLYAGRLAKYEGKQAFWSGIFGGVENVLGGASSIGRIKMAQGGGSGMSSSGGAPPPLPPP